MREGARAPEELDTLLEDAFLLRDRTAFGALFDAGAVFAEVEGIEARGGEAIGRAVTRLWECDRTYVARGQRILRTRDTALVVADAGIHVLRRGGDGKWRAAISLLDLGHPNQREDT